MRKVIRGVFGVKDKSGEFDLPKDEISLSNLVVEAEKGSSKAKSILSLAYLEGGVLDKDIGKAYRLIEEASEDIYSLNMCYKNGRSKGLASAHYGLYLMNSNGWGVIRNQEIATKYLKISADKAYPEAMGVLGINYLSGFYGVKRDFEKAEYWLKKAEEKGNKAVWYHLFRLYYKLSSEHKDDSKAFSYIYKSAQEGWPNDLRNLGEMYEKGCGVDKDLITAGMYYYLAACQGAPKVTAEQSPLVRVCKDLDSDSIKSIRELANNWIKENVDKASRFNAFNEDLVDPIEIYKNDITNCSN